MTQSQPMTDEWKLLGSTFRRDFSKRGQLHWLAPLVSTFTFQLLHVWNTGVMAGAPAAILSELK